MRLFDVFFRLLDANRFALFEKECLSSTSARVSCADRVHFAVGRVELGCRSSGGYDCSRTGACLAGWLAGWFGWDPEPDGGASWLAG